MPVAVDPRDPHDAAARAAEVLRRGGVVVLPTDTVYGLAALPQWPGAMERLSALKGRGVDVPVAVLCASASQALDLAAPEAVVPEIRRIAERLWPGPLTLVLPRRAGLDLALGDPADTVGLRCPDHPLVQAIACAVGPVATTSANRHGVPTPPTAAEAVAQLDGAVDLVLDGGRCTAPPSSVVAIGPDGTRRVLREGPVTAAQLDAAVG